MISTPLVSILIVTWNRRRELARAIDSAFRQDYGSLEVIVIDNASSDGSHEMVLRRFPRARLIRSGKNLGCPAGRNLGFAYCEGKYIYLLDDDGVLDTKAVSIAVKRAESDESIGIVSSAIHEEDHGEFRIRPGANTPLFQHSFVGCCFLLRSEALRRVGPFPEDFFRQAEEEDLAIRLLDAGWFCFFEPKSVIYHSPSKIGRDPILFNYYSIRNTTKTGLGYGHFPTTWGDWRLISSTGFGYLSFGGI